MSSKSFNPCSSYSSMVGILFSSPGAGCSLETISSSMEKGISLRRMSMIETSPAWWAEVAIAEGDVEGSTFSHENDMRPRHRGYPLPYYIHEPWLGPSTGPQIDR